MNLPRHRQGSPISPLAPDRTSSNPTRCTGDATIKNPGPFGSLISFRSSTSRRTASSRCDTIKKRPVVIDDAIAIRLMVNISMSGTTAPSTERSQRSS